MCGRYSFYPPKNFSTRFSLDLSSKDFDKLTPNGNVTPGQIIPIIIKNKNSNQLNFLTWGYLPTWAKSTFKPLINARSENILDKPFFKHALLSNRCLIPASGFYEWPQKSKSNTPHYFSLKDDSLFSFAGLYSSIGYTIITTSPNSLVESVHNRMPVILNQINESAWLDPNSSPTLLLSLLKPSSSQFMSSTLKNPHLDLRVIFG